MTKLLEYMNKFLPILIVNLDLVMGGLEPPTAAL